MIWMVTRAIFGFRAPIVVVALEHDAGIELVFHELVRTGADRLLAERVEARPFSKYFFGTM